VFSGQNRAHREIDGVTNHRTLRSTKYGRLQPLKAVIDAIRVGKRAEKAQVVIALDEASVLAAHAVARRQRIPHVAILHGTYSVLTLRGPAALSYRWAF